MSNNAITSHYFSGQGEVMLATRDATTGRPKKFRPVGNVSDLKIDIAATVVEHKESQTGQRGTDLRLQTGVTVTMSMTMENFIKENLAQALRGDTTAVAAGTITSEVTTVYPGGISAAAHIKINTLVVKQGATTLIAFTDSVTPYDYKEYDDGGSVLWNDGTVIAQSAMGFAATAITVGATTVVTVAASTGAVVGGNITCRGFTGADAGTINGKVFIITAFTGTTITFNAVTTGLTITVGGSPKVAWDGIAATFDYSWAASSTINALTVGITDIYVRFEGLNTAEGNNPVVVEVFRFSTDPLKELALIGDTVQQYVLEGSILLDPLQLTGSQYFNVRLLT